MTAGGGNIGEVAKRANVFTAASLSLLYLIYLGEDSAHTEKWPVVTSQTFILNFIHINEKKKKNTLVLLQEEYTPERRELTNEFKTP